MQMQKKVTRKEDGRFLVYYHFPDTATPEETEVFEGIEEERGQDSGVRIQEFPTPSAQHPTPDTGGTPHV